MVLGSGVLKINHLIEWCRLKSQGKDLKLPEETEDPEKNEDDKDRGNIEYQEPHDDRVTTLPKYRGILKEQKCNERQFVV